MVERLARGPASVSELARPFDMALPSVVQHLGLLETAGIVSSTKVGRVRTYQLAPDALMPALNWIARQRLPAEKRLDRLGAFLSQSHAKEPHNPMMNTVERSQTHATFVIERTYPVSVKAVWHALSDNDARDQWFGGGEAFDTSDKSHDFRVGGQGIEDGQWHAGPRSRFVSTYTDIVEPQRIVFTYDMWVDQRHLSTSLATIVLEPVDEGTRLTYTEQAVHLDGLDTVEGREEGMREIFDKLGAYLSRSR